VIGEGLDLRRSTPYPRLTTHAIPYQPHVGRSAMQHRHSLLLVRAECRVLSTHNPGTHSTNGTYTCIRVRTDVRMYSSTMVRTRVQCHRQPTHYGMPTTGMAWYACALIPLLDLLVGVWCVLPCIVLIKPSHLAILLSFCPFPESCDIIRPWYTCTYVMKNTVVIKNTVQIPGTLD
jgi:hypothetical protein